MNPAAAALLVGVTLLLHASVAFSSTGLAGDTLGVVTAMFYAGYILAVKGLRDRGETTLHLMAVTTTITAVFLLPVALASGEQMLPGSADGWWILIGLALVSPVLAALFAWMLLSEALVPRQVLGGIIVLAGIYLARRGARAAE